METPLTPETMAWRAWNFSKMPDVIRTYWAKIWKFSSGLLTYNNRGFSFWIDKSRKMRIISRPLYMVFQVHVLLFRSVLLRCCSFRPVPTLLTWSAPVGPWAVYHVEHMVNVSLQILLCRVPSCEENLVEDRITWSLAAKVWKFAYPSGSIFIIESSMATKLLWGRHRMLWRTLASTLEASELWM